MLFSTNNINDLYLTEEGILSKIDDYNLFKRYIGNFSIGRVMSSPLRKDKNPSFCIYYSYKNDKLMYKDYATGDSGDIFRFLGNLFKMGHSETLRRIVDEQNITLGSEVVTTNYYKDAKYYTNIGIVRQNFTNQDMKYWHSYHISSDTLKKYKVYSISHYLINGIVKSIYKEDNPMYAYCIFDHFKIYRPLANKIVKWRSNTTSYDIQGYQQLGSKSKTLIITKALKDVMVLYEMGYDSIAPPSESCTIPDEIITKLKKKYTNIYVLYDRDIAGMKNARKLWKQYKIIPIFINKKHKTKDISDYVALYGLDEGRKLITAMLK